MRSFSRLAAGIVFLGATTATAADLRLRACDELDLSVVAFDDAGQEIPVPRGPQVTLGFQAGSSPWIRFAGADGKMTETSFVVGLDNAAASTSARAQVVAAPEADTQVTLWAIVRSEQPRWMRPSTLNVVIEAASDEPAAGATPTAAAATKSVSPAPMPAPRVELRVKVTPGTCD